jgi:hypothetical protein
MTATAGARRPHRRSAATAPRGAVARGLRVVVPAVAALALAPLAQPAGSVTPIHWTLDNLARIGGHPVTVIGAPHVVDTPLGPAVEFDGTGDGLMIDVNPLAGLERFTVEVLFEPAPYGGEEQRFLHME